jgi:hypothetical protein
MNRFGIFIISVFAFLLLSLTQTTETSGQSLGLGVKAGPSVTSHLQNFRFVSGDIDLNLTPQSTWGYNFGFVYRRPINERYRLQVEPTLLTMGAQYSEGFELRGFNFQTESRTELLYFQVPLVFQLSTIPPVRTVYGRQYSYSTYHLTGGAFAGYLMNARFSGTNTGAPIGIAFAGDFSNDVADQYSAFDAGLILGAGFERGYHNMFGLEARLIFSVIDNGATTEFNFSPHNIGAVVSLYLIL